MRFILVLEYCRNSKICMTFIKEIGGTMKFRNIIERWGEMSKRTENYAKAETLIMYAF